MSTAINDSINDSIVQFWNKGYTAPNIESHIFRLSSRILKPQFNLPNNYEKLLDFGCGQGAAINYFSSLGFDARGCDLSNVDIGAAKSRYPHLADRFSVTQQNPAENPYYGWESDISVVVGVQSFYYLSKEYFGQVMEKLHSSMVPGGLFYATMMGEKHVFFEHSEPTDDEWLRCVNFSGSRQVLDNYYNFYISDEDDLKSKFSMFEPVHIGHYSMQLQENDTNNWHWTFLGRKR